MAATSEPTLSRVARLGARGCSRFSFRRNLRVGRPWLVGLRHSLLTLVLYLAVTAELATFRIFIAVIANANLLAPGSWRSAEDSAAVHKVGPPPSLEKKSDHTHFQPNL